MTTCKRLSRTVLNWRRTLTVVGLAMMLSSGACAQTNGEVAAQNERAKLAIDVLVGIDKVLQSGFSLEFSKLNLAMAQLLPKVECEGLMVAKLNLETAQMEGTSEARLLRGQADTAAIRYTSSKAQPSAADFDSGQPAREVAEKIVQGLLAMSRADNQKLVAAQVEAEALSDGCLNEYYQRAVDKGEVMQNEFLANYARSNGDRISALVRNVPLRQLLDARGALAARLAEARRARADATAARSRAVEIQRKVATPALRASRESLAAALKGVSTMLK